MFVGNISAQDNSAWVCGDDKVMELQSQSFPEYNSTLLKYNLQLRDYIKTSSGKKNGMLFKPQNGTGTAGDNVYTIPVVVHVIHPSGEAYGTGTNISYAQIRSQIEALNAAFNKSYPSYNGQSHPSYAQNANIQFCLARNTMPANLSWATGPGGLEYGVMRYADSLGAYNHKMDMASANQLLSITHASKQNFPFDKYLNIWLVKTIDGGDNVMGYAPRPLMGSHPLDGIVFRADIFGDNTTGGNYNLRFGLTQGKIISHEVGHYFNLYHIFQGGCAGANAKGSNTDACDLYGDYICDIKPCTTQNVLCNSGSYNTCKANYATGTTDDDMINDYMSYAGDDCMNTFTLNQVQRMWATLNLNRRNLWQAENLAATGVIGAGGCIPPYLNATINMDKPVVCAGSSVIFSNPVAGNNAVSYAWRFAGGTPAISDANPVTVTFNAPGDYKALLTVSDGANTRSDSLMFTIYSCKLDSSLSQMSHWYFGDYCSIDFSSGTPIKTNTALINRSIHGETTYPGQLPYIAATASVSDSAGNLLFYCNGVSVWSSAHKKITTSPIFGKSDINASSGLCYIPYPGQPGKYFIAGVYPDLDDSFSGVRFVLVDVNGNTVTPYQEFNHTALPKRFSEFLTVVPHCNGTDYWIIVKGYGMDNNNNFYCFQVTTNGIDANQLPVISSGFTHPGYGGAGNQLKANYSGDKLILCSPHGYINIESAVLYDFDSRTGRVSNEKVVPNANGYSNIQGGGAFSPNGKYFYLIRSTNFATNGQPYWLFQYKTDDLTYKVIPTTGWYFGAPFQLGPDNKLYILNFSNYLAQLSQPDEPGGGIFNEQFINFSEPTFTVHTGNSLPAFIDAKRKEPEHPDFTIEQTSCQTFIFKSLCFDNYTATWNFGDGTALENGSYVPHTYTRDGDYIVTLTLSNSNKTFGTIAKKVTILPLNIAITGPDSVCNTNKFSTQYFGSVIPSVEYKWSVQNGSINGADDLSYVGIAWPPNSSKSLINLSISSGKNCTLNANKYVTVLQGPVFNWQIKNSICLSDSVIKLNAHPAGGTFSGRGVQDSLFFPLIAGAGNHELTYRYGEGTVCYSEIKTMVSVIEKCLPGIPNAFTPNGDGLNDVFRIPAGTMQKLTEFTIYSRWGEKVFTTNILSEFWDGKINGLPATPGVYIYFISGTKSDAAPVKFKGTVLLIR